MLYLFLEKTTGICPNHEKGWHRIASEEKDETHRLCKCTCGDVMRVLNNEFHWMWRGHMAQRDYLSEVT